MRHFLVVGALVLSACGGYRVGTTDHENEPTVVSFERGCEGQRSDDITIEGVELRDRTLNIHFAHATGCGEHRYRVCGAERILRTDPGLWTVSVIHHIERDDDSDVECDAERLGVLQAEIPRGRDLIGLESLEGRNFTIVVD
ncbi:MAG: hypothetical protein ACI9KE_000946 [Polyangiales bacterium]|jgi:hypothetical protein